MSDSNIMPHEPAMKEMAAMSGDGGAALDTSTQADKLLMLLRQGVEEKATDLHLRAGAPPRLRIDGDLYQVKGFTPGEEGMLAFFERMMTPAQMEHFREEWELDGSHSVPGVCRIRMNLYRERQRFCAAVRIITSEIPSMEDVMLPKTCEHLCQLPRGLVLVTGPTGSGKSTTLAAMINYINATRRCHIVTIEDPIEYEHQDKKAMISQRELDMDTKSFAAGLRHAFRQDPDVVMIGEMRDRETIATAITLAETGHLTFSTLHTGNCTQTLTRIIDVFPPHQQEQIRLQLAMSLEAVIAQRLLRRTQKRGLIAAREILVASRAVQNLIREGKYNQIYSAIQTGSEDGMITLEASLESMIRNGYIDLETALEVASDPRDFRTKMAMKKV